MAQTVFLTYVLGNPDVTGGTYSYEVGKSYGMTSGIHCTSIEKLETDNFSDKTVSIRMPSSDYFPFLKSNFEVNNLYDGQGFTATKLFILMQVVNGTGASVKPAVDKWKIIDVTNQLDGFQNFIDGSIQKEAFDDNSYILIGQSKYLNAPFYNLDYLSYPSTNAGNENRLGFGEEAFFFGNVTTNIQAIAYTTEIPIVLPLNQFNSTTNATWDTQSPVQISEIGIFDNNNVLVAVGKFNNPISKDSSTYRTLQFGLDF
jgi:hypothetical protein